MKVEIGGRRRCPQVLDVAVSVDAAWQKRYGFNSLNGVIFVISIDTGCVLDYVVKTKHCQECKSNRNATEEWEKKAQKNMLHQSCWKFWCNGGRWCRRNVS